MREQEKGGVSQPWGSLARRETSGQSGEQSSRRRTWQAVSSASSSGAWEGGCVSQHGDFQFPGNKVLTRPRELELQLPSAGHFLCASHRAKKHFVLVFI